MVPVLAKERTENRKLGAMSATYVSQATCPTSCPLFGKFCYAENGPMGFITRRLNKSEVTEVDEIANIEAEMIGKLSGRNTLRLHVVGDTTTDAGAKALAAAAEAYTARFGRPVYSYTHCHETKRESWGNISILRSCETMEQVKQAHADDFAAAMVVPEFQDDKPYDLGDGFRGVPCLHQTGKKSSCDTCGLCMNADKLRKAKSVILFESHGSRKGGLKQLLQAKT